MPKLEKELTDDRNQFAALVVLLWVFGMVYIPLVSSSEYGLPDIMRLYVLYAYLALQLSLLAYAGFLLARLSLAIRRLPSRSRHEIHLRLVVFAFAMVSLVFSAGFTGALIVL